MTTASIDAKLDDFDDSRYARAGASAFRPCPVLIQVSAVYCFFNLTGLPLVFRQHECEEAAGQSDEHELASSNQPLLYSYNDVDSPYACSMRIGKGFNEFKSYFNRLTAATGAGSSSERKLVVPKWSKPFGLDSGSSFRALHVLISNGQDVGGAQQSDSSYVTPDWVYYIGIENQAGQGPAQGHHVCLLQHAILPGEQVEQEPGCLPVLHGVEEDPGGPVVDPCGVRGNT